MSNARDIYRGLSPFQRKPLGGISASTLRIIALFLMLLDHAWATIIPGNNWMTYMGRLAFPIFAFQITEGFLHTSDRRQYARRLFVFGLISEIPFNYMVAASPIYPFHQNVMFTLLLGLRAMEGIEMLRQARTWKSLVQCLLRLAGCLILSAITFVDYGAMGVMTVLLFYIFRGFSFAWIGQLAGMALLYVIFFKGYTLIIPLFGHTLSLPAQSFAVLSLLIIWLYNGKKGKGGKYLQLGSYCFYPLHMILLYLLAVLTQ